MSGQVGSNGMRPGRADCKPMAGIAQIDGVYAASVTNEEAGTGCTVIVCPKGATGAVDVRGGAPASRETDLLRPEETVDVLHAVVLSGGSAFGLSASCGVAEELERRGIGVDPRSRTARVSRRWRWTDRARALRAATTAPARDAPSASSWGPSAP